MVAVGRKNWLFAGSMAGAQRAALLYSVMQSCTLVGVPPFAYLTDVLRRLATHPHRSLDQLTPTGWARTFGPRHSASLASLLPWPIPLSPSRRPSSDAYVGAQKCGEPDETIQRRQADHSISSRSRLAQPLWDSGVRPCSWGNMC